jgi:two-component system nitrate/nitrite response regulator NarL
MSSRTVFIADPQPPFRAGLRGLLEQAGLEVVGEAGDVLEALGAIAEVKPAVCVVDADIRGGLVAVRRITRDPEGPSVLVLAAAPTPDGLLAALRAGASGYLPRGTEGNGLVRAVESMLDGNFAVTRASVASLIHEVRGGGRQRLSIGGVPVSLTEREAQVLELLASGMPTQEIARELGLSPVTVRRHVGAIAAKVGTRGRERLLRLVRPA